MLLTSESIAKHRGISLRRIEQSIFGEEVQAKIWGVHKKEECVFDVGITRDMGGPITIERELSKLYRRIQKVRESIRDLTAVLFQGSVI